MGVMLAESGFEGSMFSRSTSKAVWGWRFKTEEL